MEQGHPLVRRVDQDISATAGWRPRSEGGTIAERIQHPNSSCVRASVRVHRDRSWRPRLGFIRVDETSGQECKQLPSKRSWK
jgi:hypothetical protein